MYNYQIARLERLYGFVTSKNFEELDMQLQIDIILSFFMNCYHLKDWLIKSGIDKKVVWDFIEQTYELKVCHDLTNSTKHLGIDASGKKFVSLYSWEKAGWPSPISRSYDYLKKIQDKENPEHLVLSVDGHEIDCKDFMKNCMQKWNEFLNNTIQK